LREYAHVWDEFREEFTPSIETLYVLPSSEAKTAAAVN
jgi:hypothetical protein